MLGIGQGRITDNLATFIRDVDSSLSIADEKSISMVYEMLDTEGIYLGASSALNVVAAYEMAQKLGSGGFPSSATRDQIAEYSTGKTIVTVLCDGAYRYQTRLFSKAWLKSKGLESAIPPHLQKYAVLD